MDPHHKYFYQNVFLVSFLLALFSRIICRNGL